MEDTNPAQTGAPEMRTLRVNLNGEETSIPANVARKFIERAYDAQPYAAADAMHFALTGQPLPSKRGKS